MKRLTSCVGLLLLLCGCQRDVCDYGERQVNRPDSLSGFWADHKDLLISDKPCDVGGTPEYESITVDFDPEPSSAPMVAAVEKVEAKGWTRGKQAHTDTTFEVVFIKDDQELIVRGLTHKGRTQVSYTWPKAKKADEPE